MAGEPITTAAGGVVWRKRPRPARTKPRIEVLVVHRPSYDDWTFPKGKTDPGETLPVTAVREIAEETGLRVRLGHPLQHVIYPVTGGTKHVAYWCARVVGADDAPFVPNKEVDEIRWVGLRDADALLTYPHDSALLATFSELEERQAHRTRTLIVLRHGKAVPRSDDLDDLDRPLTTTGMARAQELVPRLAAYGIRAGRQQPGDPLRADGRALCALDQHLLGDRRPALRAHPTGPGAALAGVTAGPQEARRLVHAPADAAVDLRCDRDRAGATSRPARAVVVHHRGGTVHATEKLL